MSERTMVGADRAAGGYCERGGLPVGAGVRVYDSAGAHHRWWTDGLYRAWLKRREQWRAANCRTKRRSHCLVGHFLIVEFWTLRTLQRIFQNTDLCGTRSMPGDAATYKM